MNILILQTDILLHLIKDVYFAWLKRYLIFVLCGAYFKYLKICPVLL